MITTMISQHLLVLCVVIFDRQTYSNNAHILCNRMNIDDCQTQLIEKKNSPSDFVVSTKSTVDDDDLRPLEVENEAPSMSALENLIINYVSDYIPIVGQTLKVPNQVLPAPRFFNKALGMSHPCCLCCRNMLNHCRKIGKSSCDEQVQICCRQSRRRRRHWKSPSSSSSAAALSSLFVDLAKMPANFDRRASFEER